MRMSSGASVAYEKPRSGRSICIEETPRSSSTASARTPLAASCESTIAKSPRRKRASTPEAALNRSKYGFTVGSRSMATSFPLPSRSRASRRACPPAPKVASTTVSPGRTARSSRTSSASTGTCGSAPLLCKTFGNIVHPPFDGLEVLRPGRPVPDLQVVVDADDHDFPLESAPARRAWAARARGPACRARRRRRPRRRSAAARASRARTGRDRRAAPRPRRPACARIHVEIRVDPLPDHDRRPRARREIAPAT